MVDAWRITRWGVWSLPGRVTAAVLLVEALAVGLVAADALTTRPTGRDLVLAVLLLALATVHTEVATGVERIRRRVATSSYFDLSSVWTFAAALLLPPAPAALLIALVYLHLWLRVWKPAKLPAYRHVYTAATVVLAARAAHEVVAGTGGVQGWPDDLAGLGSLATAVAVYIPVNAALVALALALSRPSTSLRELVGEWDDIVLEVGTLSLGALAAIAVTVNPWLVVLVLPPLLVLHRAVLARQLMEHAAKTDGKTGLLTAAAWHSHAAKTLREALRSREAAAVLILDLDHFKTVNDTHGHLAGDQVLVAVAAEVRRAVRDGDEVGRFGGEEFVVLLPDLPRQHGDAELRAIAERIRRRIAALRVPVDTPDGPLTIDNLSTSVGGAAFPAAGTSLEQLMTVADAALYRAKRDGRNAVRISAAPQPPQLPAGPAAS